MNEQESKVCDLLVRLSEIVATFPRALRRRPAFGGRFGNGGYSLCSYFEIARELDSVTFFVIHDASGFVLGSSESRTEALAEAREVLGFDATELNVLFSRFAVWAQEDRACRAQLAAAEREAYMRSIRDSRVVPIKSPGRRRKKIFEESNGQCYYCSTALTLDGDWHIEHKMPKALGGTNEPINLVAACAPCNREKSDTTDLEFIAKRSLKAPT